MKRLLHTDAYKFAMAEAGWPLRRETFVWSCRKGGPHLLPFDVEAMVRAHLPSLESEADRTYLASAGYSLSSGALEALAGAVRIDALPKGAWFFDREPAFSITGPSALVSWLEPLLIQLHYRIQVATLAKLAPDDLPAAVARVTCAAQRDVVLQTLDAISVKPPPIEIDSEGYVEGVRARVRELVEIVGDPTRVFEVGFRSVTCPEQHSLALEACRAEGVIKTSHVAGAQQLDLVPVGTMGHEHVQRFGSDAAAFRAMLERRPGSATFLLDTFSTLDSGLPAAFALMTEFPERRSYIRYDSGDKEGQYLYACARARTLGIDPVHVLEDAFDADLTRRFEEVRAFTGVSPEHQLYGIGGHIVRSGTDPLSRDRVSAVFKLSQTGPRATMKFADVPGKESMPGRPILYRVYREGDWTGLVAQEGETVEADAVRLTGVESVPRRLRFTHAECREFARPRPELSPETRALVDRLQTERNAFSRTEAL